MTNRELLTSAVALVCEDKENIPADYEERAPYLLASFCTQCLPIDLKYRTASNLLLNPPYRETVMLSLDLSFPLSPIFAPAAIYYLGAMLVIDENEVLSDKLFDLYVNSISEIQSALPMWSSPIKEVY